jgi:hypothetical protein
MLPWSTSSRRWCVSTIGAASLWDKKCNTYYGTCECRSPTDCTDTSQWRCNDCSCGTRAVEKLTHEDWDYPNRESSKYFMTINCIHTTTRGAHICLQTIVLYGCNFANGYDINSLRMSSFYTTFCGQTKRVLRMRDVVNVHKSHLWARDNPHAIREGGY